jgi:isocitrate dehydrogenase (NAD+)
MSAKQDAPREVTLVPGGWVGPECCDVVERIVAAAGVDIAWTRFPAIDSLSEELIASAKKTGLVLKGRMGSERTTGQLPPTVELRKALGTWATVRRARAIPGVKARFPEMDVVVIRESSEDIYAGMEHKITEGVFEAVKVTTAAACERIARYAFEYARANGRRKVTIVHKSNIMKKSDGLFLRTAQKVGEEYPEIETEEAIVDALCMRLVRWPMQFDVLLCANLFGDIVSDLCAGLAGGITASASVGISDDVRLFAMPHGRVPDLVGKDAANPVPMLTAAVLLLQHMGENAAADRISDAIATVTAEGICTTDLGGSAKCSEVAAAIEARVRGA